MQCKARYHRAGVVASIGRVRHPFVSVIVSQRAQGHMMGLQASRPAAVAAPTPQWSVRAPAHFRPPVERSDPPCKTRYRATPTAGGSLQAVTPAQRGIAVCSANDDNIAAASGATPAFQITAHRLINPAHDTIFLTESAVLLSSL